MGRPPRRPKINPWLKKAREPASALWGPGGGDLSMWRDGVVLALIPAVIGLSPLMMGHLEIPSRRGSLILDGWQARAAGLAAMALGACVHFHFFWGRHDSLSESSQPAMIGGALVFLVALGFVVLSAFA